MKQSDIDVSKLSINELVEILTPCSRTVLVVVWAISKHLLKSKGDRLVRGHWVQTDPPSVEKVSA